MLSYIKFFVFLFIFALIIDCSPYSLPQNKSLYKEETAFKFYKSSIDYFLAGEYQLALQQYQKAVSLYPKSIWTERIQKRIQRVYRKQKAEQLLKALQPENLQ